MGKFLVFFFLPLFSVAQDTIQIGNHSGPFVPQPGKIYANGIISGFRTVDQFTAAGTNVWKSRQQVAKPSIVLINGQHQLPGRFPNTGYLSYTNVAANRITVNATIPSFFGGEVVVRKNEWTLDKGRVWQQTGNTVTYNNEAGDQGITGWKCFFQNHINTLDVEGEWCWSDDGFLYVYAAAAPVAKISQTIGINGSGATFVNVTVEGSNDYACFGANRFINCKFNYNGSFGIYAANGVVDIQGCEFNTTNNVAILLKSCQATIRNNRIWNTGIEGQGNGYGVTGLEYSAISTSGCSGAQITGNSINKTGYNAIHFLFAGGLQISRNIIDSFNIVKDDGGGIYTWNAPDQPAIYPQSFITQNVILRGIGAPASRSNGGYVPAYGIYLDDNAANISVIANTVAHCIGSGIYLHNAHDLTVTGNTVFNCGQNINGSTGQLQFLGNSGYLIRNVELKRNVFVSRERNQTVVKYDSDFNDIAQFGTADSNWYMRPVNESSTFYLYTRPWTSAVNYNLNQWRSYTRQDPNSRTSWRTVTSTDSIRFEFAGHTGKTVKLPGTWVDHTGKGYTTLQLAPYESKVLLFVSAGTVLALSDVPVFNPRPPATGDFIRQGNFLKIHKRGVLNLYAVDGRLLLSKEVRPGQLVELPRHFFFAKLIY